MLSDCLLLLAPESEKGAYRISLPLAPAVFFDLKSARRIGIVCLAGQTIIECQERTVHSFHPSINSAKEMPV
jgi:hypothetical protein